MTPLRWTREAPKEAGIYMRKHADGTIDACVVYRMDEIDGGGLFYTGALYHGGPLSGEDCVRFGYKTADVGEWAGPIAPPEEPRSGDPEAEGREEA